MAIIINVTKTKAMIRRVYTFNEHAVWHSILNGDVKNDFVSENMLALSTFGIYHWQKGTDYAWGENGRYDSNDMSYIVCILVDVRHEYIPHRRFGFRSSENSCGLRHQFLKIIARVIVSNFVYPIWINQTEDTMWGTVWSRKTRCNTLLCNYFWCRLLLDVINGFSITSFFIINNIYLLIKLLWNWKFVKFVKAMDWETFV